MRFRRPAAALLICGGLWLAGCEREPLPTVPASTSPVPPPGPATATAESVEVPVIKPPHGGRLVDMGERRGYVEWLADVGRLYVVDVAGAPLLGAEEVTLTSLAANGPEQTVLTPCIEADFTGACWAGPNGRSWEADASAVVRFQLAGRPIRVVLVAPPAPLSTLEASLETLKQTRDTP